MTEVVINQSRLATFMDCPRKYFWGYVKNMVAPRPQMNLEVGSAVHEGLAKLESEIHAGTELDKALELALEAARDRFNKVVPPTWTPDEEQFYAEHHNMIAALLKGYVIEYGGSTPWQSIGIEVAGTVLIGDGPHSLRFRTDNIATWNRGLWVIDHKTMAKLDQRDFQKYQMDLQVTAYAYGVAKILQKSVQGVIIDALIKTKIPKYHFDVFTRTQDDYDEFEPEFNTWVDKIQEYTTKAVLAHSAGMMAGQVSDPRETTFEERTAFPKNTKECFRYGTCPFHPLCTSHGKTVDIYEPRQPDYVDDAALLATGKDTYLHAAGPRGTGSDPLPG